MDLSVYISELLNEHGTISIPQLGVFKQVRKRGYYNADEGKLYPPYFETGFEQKTVTDDTLLRYLIEKSKVSASSAKFFLDRYVQNIIQQAEIGEALIGNLGWLSKELDTITFRPATNVNAASAAFGFSPISVGVEAPEEVAVAGAVAPVAETQPEPETPVAGPQAETAASQETATATVTPQEIAPKTFSIEKELEETPQTSPKEEEAIITDVSEDTTSVTNIAEETAPATNSSLPEEPATATATAPATNTSTEQTFSIEKELAQTPPAAPEEEEPVVAPKPKPAISPLVRQHKPADKPKPVAEPVVAATQVTPPAPPTIADEPVVVEGYHEPAKPFYLRPLFYAVAVFAILAFGAIYMLKNAAGDTRTSQPSTAEPVVKSTPSTDSVVVKNTAPDTVVIKPQPVKEIAAKDTPLPPSTEFAPEVETPVAAATHPIVNSNNYKYVLIGGSYGTYEQALAACNRYKAVGISATPFENVRKLYKVALGYYKTYGEGQKAKEDFVKHGKVLSWKLYVETLRK